MWSKSKEMKSLPEIVENNKEVKSTRSGEIYVQFSFDISAGESLAESIIDMVHLIYQKKTAHRFLTSLIARLTHLSKEFNK
jgi:hypothetical protein